MYSLPTTMQGLTHDEVLRSREKHGTNSLAVKKEHKLLKALISLGKEPMVILLLAAALIHLSIGNTGDAIFMASAIVLVSAISLYQDSRSTHALEQLKNLTQANCKVIREAKMEDIPASELVIGDYMLIEEGTSIAADGIIIQSNDFSVNESILTGESLAVYKDKTADNNEVFQGTNVAGGLAIITVTAIGNSTKLGKIGDSLLNIPEEKTPLEIQISSFVKKMVIFGAIVFLLVWGINYSRSHDLADSLLKALTLAMSILPEEIPVAFSTFMALGAWRLMKMGIVVKQMKTVETLGSATVICADKTGTLTQNKMSLARVFSWNSKTITDPSGNLSEDETALIRTAMWASEPIPFDPMEVALHKAYEQHVGEDERPEYTMVHEYPLSGKPPMMTHIFANTSGKRIIAAKGAPEAMMAVSNLSEGERHDIGQVICTLAEDGYRVLGVAEASFTGNNYPKLQQEFSFRFKGLVAFSDPPKENIPMVLNDFYKAGIAVKIITGDNPVTTRAIAKQIGFRGDDQTITGDELMKLNDTSLQEQVMKISIFTRMFPEAKLRIINALKANKQLVAMTGDGVNDGPALKAAHIGVAMGKKGTEIAKDAASLVLVEDDLSKMVDAVAMGRRIYANLKKAIQYIISIHIPIILTVFIPLALNWVYPNIFLPAHVILLELIMGPTCSIIYENEPMEKLIMEQKPRPVSATFFNSRELGTSVLQGLTITAGVLGIYQYAVYQGLNEDLTRTMVFTTLIAANIVLTLVNRSFYYSIVTTLNYKNNLVALIIGITIALSGLLLYARPFTRFFEFERLDFFSLSLSVGAGCLSVIWYELIKIIKRINNPQ